MLENFLNKKTRRKLFKSYVRVKNTARELNPFVKVKENSSRREFGKKVAGAGAVVVTGGGNLPSSTILGDIGGKVIQGEVVKTVMQNVPNLAKQLLSRGFARDSLQWMGELSTKGYSRDSVYNIENVFKGDLPIGVDGKFDGRVLGEIGLPYFDFDDTDFVFKDLTPDVIDIVFGKDNPERGKKIYDSIMKLKELSGLDDSGSFGEAKKIFNDRVRAVAEKAFERLDLLPENPEEAVKILKQLRSTAYDRGGTGKYDSELSKKIDKEIQARMPQVQDIKKEKDNSSLEQRPEKFLQCKVVKNGKEFILTNVTGGTGVGSQRNFLAADIMLYLATIDPQAKRSDFEIVREDPDRIVIKTEHSVFLKELERVKIENLKKIEYLDIPNRLQVREFQPKYKRQKAKPPTNLPV